MGWHHWCWLLQLGALGPWKFLLKPGQTCIFRTLRLLRFDLVAGCLSGEEWSGHSNSSRSWIRELVNATIHAGVAKQGPLFIDMFFFAYVVIPNIERHWKEANVPKRPGHEWPNGTSVGWAENRRWWRDAGDFSSSLLNQSCTLIAPWLYLGCTRQGVVAVSCLNNLLQQLAASCWTCWVSLLFSCWTARRKVLYTCLQKDVQFNLQQAVGAYSRSGTSAIDTWASSDTLRSSSKKRNQLYGDPLVDQSVASHWNEKYWVTECEDSFFSRQKDWARIIRLQAMRQSLPCVFFCLLTCFQFGLLAANACLFMIPLSMQDCGCECKRYSLIAHSYSWSSCVNCILLHAVIFVCKCSYRAICRF